MYVSFRSENEAFISTLEAVLACARRGGIEVVGMHAGRCNLRQSYARLLVQAPEQDMLQLFMARLGNMIDIFALAEVEPVPDCAEAQDSAQAALR